jgi:Bacterial PH domain
MSTPAPVFDRQEQLQKIEALLLEGEQIYAVYDMKGGGTGFIGITSKRVIVYDKTYLTTKQALVSIPYSRIVTVAAEDQPGLLTGHRGFFSTSALTLTMQGDKQYHFDFRGADKALHAHNLILWHILRSA